MTRKTYFLRGILGLSSTIQFGTDARYGFKVLHQSGKGLKLKVGTFCGLIAAFVVVRKVCPPPILSRVNHTNHAYKLVGELKDHASIEAISRMHIFIT